MPAFIRYLLGIICLFFLSFLVPLLSPSTVSADYTQYRNDSNHTGLAPYNINGDLILKWTSQNLGNLSYTPAVDSDGNIYVPTSSKLVAFDKDGNKKWEFISGPVRGTPSIDSQGNIYITSSNSSCDAYVYSIDKLGQQRWRYDLQPPNSPCGSPSYPTFSADRSTLYFSTSHPNLSLYAFNLDGTIKWQKNISGQQLNPPTAAPDGTLYVGASNGFLYALNPDSTIKWQKFISSNGFTTPSIDSSGNLYLLAFPSSNMSFTPQGTLRWTNTNPTNFTIGTIQAISNHRMYSTYSKTLRAIDSTSGTTLWEWSPPITITNNLLPPIIDNDGNIYVIAKNSLYIIDPAGLTQKTITLNNNDLVQAIIPEPNQMIITQSGLNNTGSVFKLTSTPTKTPLIFIPGIGGSELKIKTATNWSQDNGHGGTYSRNYLAEEKIWMNEPEARAIGNDDYFDVLRMKPDGTTSEADVGLTGNLYEGAYKPTIDFFTENGYTLNKDLFIFPYDWRLDISTTKTPLDNKINLIKQFTGSQKVDIVAHSMGGLVARNYIADPQKAANVQKLITLGTPHLGSVEGLKALLYGACITRIELQNLPICFGLSLSEVKDVLHNMISAYELIPTKKYYQLYSNTDPAHPTPYIDSRDVDSNGITGILSYMQLKQLLSNIGQNTNLFSSTETFHFIDNNLDNTNGVDTHIISGSGKSTLGQIVERNSFDFFGIKLPVKDEIIINGDDTVPLFSSSLIDPLQGISFKGDAKSYYTQQNHGALSSPGPALNLVRNILDGNPILPTGVDTTSYPLNGSLFSVHSPVNIHVYDQNNNHTGLLPNGDIETNIPGSSYDELGDAKFIYLPDEGIYSVKFEATDQGSFDFKIRQYENDENTRTTLFNDVPLTQDTVAASTVDTNNANVTILSIDENGDGTIDTALTPSSNLTGLENQDLTPPQSTIQLEGTSGSNNWYKSDVTVTLTATDDNSGVNKIEYSLDNGQTIQTYSEPIKISTEGIIKLKAKTTDNAGNEEVPKEIEIKIDKTSPNVSISASPSVLWPPNGSFINILVDGFSQDDNLTATNFLVEDEYDLTEPLITTFQQTISLQASRKEDDQNGRVYTIKAIATDQAGNQTTAETKVLVPHDQGKKD